MDLGLAGSHVLVAGASRGLGFAIGSALLGEGARVTAVGRDAEALATAREQWLGEHAEGAVNTLPLDLSEPTSATHLSRFLERQGVLDGVIVVAGSGRPTGGSSTQAHFSALSRNVMPALVTVTAAEPLLRRSSSGAIVLVSSIAGSEFITCPPEYAAAKSALRAYGAHWSREFAPTRVNVLAPGNMLTQNSVWERRMREDPSTLDAFLRREVTLARVAQPSEVARVAVFLASSAASFMTGSTVFVDGGQVRQW